MQEEKRRGTQEGAGESNRFRKPFYLLGVNRGFEQYTIAFGPPVVEVVNHYT